MHAPFIYNNVAAAMIRYGTVYMMMIYHIEFTKKYCVPSTVHHNNVGYIF